MSVFKSEPLLVVVIFCVFFAFCLLVHSAYKCLKALEYENPVDVEAQVLQTCPKVVQPIEPSATYHTNKIGHNRTRIHKVLALPVVRFGHFIFSSRRAPSVSILDESFTCIDKDIVRRSVYDQSPILFRDRSYFCQPRTRTIKEDVPSPFDIYVASRRPRMSADTPNLNQQSSVPPSRSTPRTPRTPRTSRTPSTDVWWLAANVIIKPAESMEQKPTLTITGDHVRRRSAPTILGDISNKNATTAPILFFTPPTPRKAVKWSGKRISQVTVNSNPANPVMKSLKAQGRKPPEPRSQYNVHKRPLGEIKENIPEGYF